MSAVILLGFLRHWYSYSAFPQSQFLLQLRKGFGLVDFQGSWVNYSCTCLGKLGYNQNRELGMIILVWKKMLVISMYTRCWRQDYLCSQFWRIWYMIWYMKSHVLFFSFSLTCGKAAPLLVWWWGKLFARRGSSWQSWCWVEDFQRLPDVWQRVRNPPTGFLYTTSIERSSSLGGGGVEVVCEKAGSKLEESCLHLLPFFLGQDKYILEFP